MVKSLSIIVAQGRTKDVVVGVNGEVKKFPVNKAIPLEDYQREALENAGYQLVALSDKAADGAEGSALAAAQDENRTEPHQNPDDPATDDTGADSVQARDASGAPIIKGGDEPDPLHGQGASGAQSADSQPGEEEDASLPGLTGKTTAQLEEIAVNEGVTFSDEVKTNAQRIEAIEAHRATNA